MGRNFFMNQIFISSEGLDALRQLAARPELVLADSGRLGRRLDFFGKERLGLRVGNAVDFFFPQSGSYRVQLARFLGFTQRRHAEGKPAAQHRHREGAEDTGDPAANGAQKARQECAQ